MTRLPRTLVRREVPDCAAELGTLPPLLQRVYAARGIATAEELDLGFTALLDPKLLRGMTAACERLQTALDEQQRILIVGDFDADGATSTALAIEGLRALGARSVDYLVPNRFEYGYGLTPEIVELALEKAPELIITVDNGISSIDGVATANRLGIDVVVTDHHLAGDELPDAAVILNPNQPACEFPSKALAGVGVMFYLLLGLRAHLRAQGWFVRKSVAEPHMAELLDLVALGTVADVVPLDRNNRILVRGGIARIRSGGARPGIAALLSVARRNASNLGASDLGFAVGPRLNAAGRLDDMSLGIECLLARDSRRARNLALELDGMNRERQRIERHMEADALDTLRDLDVEEGALPAALVLRDERWHQGVVGILASRIKDRFYRPVIAFAQVGPTELKGSARSVEGLHMRDALDRVATQHPGLITRFGGHAMAAGLSLHTDHFEDFAAAFVQTVQAEAAQSLSPTLETDGALEPEDLHLDMAELLRTAGPWGQHFPEPLFDGEFFLQDQRIVGERHLKMRVSPDGKHRFEAIAFFVDTELWPDSSVDRVRIAYRLDVNEYRGARSLQLLVEQLEAL